MSQKWQIDRGRCAGLRIYKVKLIIVTSTQFALTFDRIPTLLPFFFVFVQTFLRNCSAVVFFKVLVCPLVLLFWNFFFLLFFSLFIFCRFSSLLAFSAFLGFSRPFSAFLGLFSFLGKVGTFQSELLPIFHPRHGNVFGGANANVIFITRGVAYTNTSLQHFQANIFTMPSSDFTPTFSSQHFHNAFFSVTTKTNCSSFALPSSLVSCPHNLHNPPHKRS